jgi:hypothetical protein
MLASLLKKISGDPVLTSPEQEKHKIAKKQKILFMANLRVFSLFLIRIVKELPKATIIIR